MGTAGARRRDQRPTEDRRLADQRARADASAARDAGGQGDARAARDSGGRQDASSRADQRAASDAGEGADAEGADARESADARPLDAAAPAERANRQLLAALEAYLATPAPERQPFEALELAAEPLNRATAEEVEALLWEDHERALRERELDAHQRGEISAADTTMRYVCFPHGVRPEQGWSLYLSMHGGGGAPPAVNDQQWNNQQRLYDRTGRIQEGLYCAPRAPTDTWNMWHRAHIDALFTKLISRLIVLEGVDPNRVLLMGYSAGGDGVYQLAPRMADQIAAAAMSAGHPNNANPYGLRNIGFTIHMGAQDNAYNRAGVAAEWGERLAALQREDELPGEPYRHEVQIHAGLGHWVELRDAAAFDFMRPFRREITPQVIKWHQSSVRHERFYWLRAHEPSAGDRLLARQEGQRFTISPEQRSELSLLLREDQLDLDQAIEVYDGQGALLYRGIATRSAGAIYRSLVERGDPAALVHAELRLPPIEPAAP